MIQSRYCKFTQTFASVGILFLECLFLWLCIYLVNVFISEVSIGQGLLVFHELNGSFTKLYIFYIIQTRYCQFKLFAFVRHLVLGTRFYFCGYLIVRCCHCSSWCWSPESLFNGLECQFVTNESGETNARY